MSVAYDRFDSPEVENPSDSSSEDGSQPDHSPYSSPTHITPPPAVASTSTSQPTQHTPDTNHPLDTNHPRPVAQTDNVQQSMYCMALTQTAIGTILLLLGCVQVFILPVVNNSKIHDIGLDKTNLYGVAIWTGAMILLCGCLAFRAAFFKDPTSMSLYFLCILVNVLFIPICCIYMLISFADHSTTIGSYKGCTYCFVVHICVCVFLSCGCFVIIIVFTQLYEAVCCDNSQMCRRVAHCCCPCFCPRVVSYSELSSEGSRDVICSERPPVLPI